MKNSTKKLRPFAPTRVLSAMLLAAAAAYVGPYVKHLGSAKPDAFPATDRTEAVQQVSSPFGHPFYRYSIVPGGARTRVELEAAAARDAVAAAHYRGFAIEKAKAVALQRDEEFYVSYRLGDDVYWTARPIHLKKGEAVMSDGNSLIRARCGNRLSATPLQPVKKRESEPDYTAFNVPTPVVMDGQAAEPVLDAPPDLPRQVSMTELLARNGAARTPLQSLLNSAVPDYAAPEPPVLSAYVPTPNEHEKPPIFASDGSLGATTLPGYYPLAETNSPIPEAVPEPGTAALEGIAFLWLAALSYKIRQRRKTG